MKLSKQEKETIILWNEAESRAEIYTYNPALQVQLTKLCARYPGMVRMTAENGCGGLTFELPKRWLRIVPPRILTPAQRAVVDRMNEAKRQNKAWGSCIYRSKLPVYNSGTRP